MKLATRLFALSLLLASGTAGAHTGHDTSGLAAGLAHPFGGMDHLLAMLAVGLWAAQTGGRRIWLLPAAFMAMLALGAGVAQFAPALQLIEPGIAASVLVLGLLVARASRFALPASLALTASFGLMHGYAHGAEMPGTVAPAAYVLGFLAATAALHLLGIAMGSTARERYARIAGVGIAASGMWMLATI